jgi:hypothetical protein
LVLCEAGSFCTVVEGVAICIPTNDYCEGKLCGDSCSTCPPDAPCPGVEEYCDEEGFCSS